jgi:CheY-like chemotaxis protein
MSEKIDEKKVTILVIEDERPLQEVIRKKLELSDFSVLTARTINQAMEYMEIVPDVEAIWLDHYLLGKETGIDFVVKLKGHDKWRSVPIFVVSNTASPDKVQSYLQLGVNKFYTKADYRLDQIIEAITAAVKEVAE